MDKTLGFNVTHGPRRYKSKSLPLADIAFQHLTMARHLISTSHHGGDIEFQRPSMAGRLNSTSYHGWTLKHKVLPWLDVETQCPLHGWTLKFIVQPVVGLYVSLSAPWLDDSFEEFDGDGVDYNPVATNVCFADRDKAFAWANKIVADNDSVLVKATNGAKNKSQPELLGSYFRCSRFGQSKSEYDPDKPKKKSRTQKCGCQFRIRAVQNYHYENKKQLLHWNIVTVKGFGCHNHQLTKYKDRHDHYAGLDEEDKAYVEQQYRASVFPRYIKSGLQKITPDKPQPSSTQIYSETSKIRRRLRREGNPAQQMLVLAVDANYVHWHEANFETHELTHVFMSHPEAGKLFCAYPHVVLIDSTYKTNVYKMTLVEVVGVTPVVSSFLIACVLIPSESEETHTWLL
ncbi:hypothetical protein RND81_13G092500 [Saponaria officinalis]|uniref:MULE transposase domain-containing protein n=1 Tax=Saponaria officinalis TaxID=3572 RepID=A0AAW1GVQ0_SAPOF